MNKLLLLFIFISSIYYSSSTYTKQSINKRSFLRSIPLSNNRQINQSQNDLMMELRKYEINEYNTDQCLLCILYKFLFKRIID